MEIYRSELTGTDESATRKASLSRMVGPSREYISSIIGWETTPPERGQRYTLSLGQGRILRTSPVQEIQEIKGGMLIRTLNSTYRIEYLE